MTGYSEAADEFSSLGKMKLLKKPFDLAEPGWRCETAAAN
jgi:hypothetical protein